MLAAARGLAPLVEATRDRFDQDRTLPAPLVDAMHAAGLFRMWVPRALGGAELDPISFLTVIEELSRLDGSLGWSAVIPAGYARLSGALDEDVARTIFQGDGPRHPGRHAQSDGQGGRRSRRIQGQRPLELRQLHRPFRLGSRQLHHRGRIGPASRRGWWSRIPSVPVPARRGRSVRHLACRRTASDRQQRLSGHRPFRARRLTPSLCRAFSRRRAGRDRFTPFP